MTDRELLQKIRGKLARYGSMVDAEDKMPYIDLTGEMDACKAEVREYAGRLSLSLRERETDLIAELYKGHFHFGREALKERIDALVEEML
jgi:hypothetical protein